MLVTRQWHESTNKLGSGRLKWISIFLPGKISAKSLNLWGVLKEDKVPINAARREKEASGGIEMEIGQISPSLLRCAALISVSAISCTNFVVHYCAQLVLLYGTSSYLCRQFDGLASGCKWHPNYPIHQLVLTEFDLIGKTPPPFPLKRNSALSITSYNDEGLPIN